MKTVQVTTEAKARPIITAFTMISADMNIDHGDISRGTWNATGLAVVPVLSVETSAGAD